MKKDSLLADILALSKPIVEELNYELYHIEYVKENGEYYLRIYIDKPEGKISLKDCETVSRRMSEILDEKDPIKDPYFLEVSSPGLNRTLFTDSHFEKSIGSEVFVQFTKAIDGKKNIKGILKEVTIEEIIINSDNEDFNIPKDRVKIANIEGEI